MNAKRRKEIGKILNKINERIMATVDEIQTDIDNIRTEELEVVDNMPENLQGTERYEMAEQAVDYLNDAYDAFEDAVINLQNAMSALEAATGE